MRPIQKWKKMGTKFSENSQRLYAFLTIQRASSGVLNHIYWSRLPKLGLAFTTISFKWYFFLSEIQWLIFVDFSSKTFRQLSQKMHCTCADRKIGHNSLFDVNWIFSRVLSKICIANQGVEDFSDYKQWLLCDKTETLSKACVTLSQFGALKEETIELKSDKKRIQNNSIFLFLFFLRRGNIKKFGSEPKLNVRQNKALSIRPCKIEEFGSIFMRSWKTCELTYLVQLVENRYFFQTSCEIINRKM